MNVRRGRVLAALATLAGGLLAAGVLAPSAAADQLDDPTAESTGSGYSVAVSFSGNAAPGGSNGGSRSVAVRASCWWAPMSGPSDDAGAMVGWYEDNVELSGAVPGYGQDIYGPRDRFEDAAKQEKDGKDLRWYRATCRDPKDYAHFNAGGLAGGQYGTILVMALPVGQAPPPPIVSAADLAAAARNAMVIPEPEIERNPKIASTGNPTIVGLPTWFWVTNPLSVGGPAGTLTITATAGNVSATVTATGGGLTLSSPAGGKQCSTGQALVKYAKGVSESSACTIEFPRASVAYANGYPVTASTHWTATWTQGNGAPGDTGLPGLDRQMTTNVPVAEVQNVVTR